MKVELLVYLKGYGSVYYEAGVYESPNIPQTLLEELGAGTDTVRVIEPDPPPPIEEQLVLVEEATQPSPPKLFYSEPKQKARKRVMK